jgi:outer membrane protein OmpA-like peptidoglycan-associated protein
LQEDLAKAGMQGSHHLDRAVEARPICLVPADGRPADRMGVDGWFDPLAGVAARDSGNSSATSHAGILNRVSAAQPLRAERSLLQLQRRYGNRYVQRVLALAKQPEPEAEVATDVEQSIERAHGGGQALDSNTRGQMESAFGSDFSGVRVHTGADAHSLNEAVNAAAFTTGSDIFFRQGTYNPTSSDGRELLAHELTHVVQQGAAPATVGRAQLVQRMCSECEEENKKEKVQHKLFTGQPQDQHEQEADRLAKAVTRTLESGGKSPGGSLASFGIEPGKLATFGADVDPASARNGGTGLAALQRQADIAKAPPGMKCITTAGHGHLPGTDVVFGQSSSDLGGQKAAIAAFARQWVADGSKDDVMVDGWASEEGPQELNWQLSCDRAEAVKAELIRQGVPDAKITTLAHGASTEFSAKDLGPNRRAIITRQPAVGPPPVPETITSKTVAPTPGAPTRTTIGVGEEVDLTHAPGAAAWATTAGTLSAPNFDKVKLTAPDTAQKVTVTAGTANIVFDVIAPNDVHMDNFPGTGIKHTKDHADSGIETLPFLLPDNVNFYNVTYRELNVGANTSGTYSCFGAGTGHCAQPAGGACGDLFLTNIVVAGKGTQAVRGDCAYSGDCLEAAPQTPGMLYFAIPYEYKVGAGAYHQFRIVVQMHMLVPFSSVLTSYKAGAFGSTTVGAATSAIPACP